ncbi:ribosomal protein L22/L17, partial [Protomyces lactucae-debilis]
ITSKKVPTSIKKMSLLANLIAHKPVSHGVLQMRFSNKRHATHLANLLENARRGAISKGMDEESLVVDQAWVTKGQYIERKWYKGRGRMTIQRRPRVGIDVRVVDKTTLEPRVLAKKEKLVRKLTKPHLISRPIYQSSMFTC